MITLSGAVITPEAGVPSLYDIGYNLRQVPRFGGATTAPWCVLQHCYACAKYAELTKQVRGVPLYALLHDADESVTGDVPRGWKPEQLRDRQTVLRARIYMSLGLSQPPLLTDRIVHQIDDQMAYSEAMVYAPQVWKTMHTAGINVNDPLADKAVQWADETLFELSPLESAYHFEDYFKELKHAASDQEVRNRPSV